MKCIFVLERKSDQLISIPIMINRPLFFIVFLLLICESCENKQNEVSRQQSANRSSSDNPDYVSRSEPSIIHLDSMPRAVSCSNLLSQYLINGNVEIGSNKQNLEFHNGLEHFKTYDVKQGLALNTILCSCNDHLGGIWLGTQAGGASYYNGNVFKSFSTLNGLSNESVNCIYEDNKSNIWFGTDGGGVTKFDGKSFQLINSKSGLGSNWVRDIIQDQDGNFWFATDDAGVSILNIQKHKGQDSFSNLKMGDGLSSNKIRCLGTDVDHNIWIGTQENGLCRYDGKFFTSYNISNGLSGNNIRCITNDSHNNLWIGTEGNGISIIDSVSLQTGHIQFTHLDQSNGLSGNSIKCIFEDKDSTIWIGTAENGVNKLRKENGNYIIEKYTVADGLSSNKVMSITQDHSGNLWFSTDGGGVCEYFGNAFCHFTTNHGLSNNIIWGGVQSNDGSLWFGTDGDGVCQLMPTNEENKYNIHSYHLGKKGVTVFCAKKDSKGNLWFGTIDNGVSKFDGKNLTTYTTAQGLVNNMVLCIEEDKDGNMWFGTGGGISKFSFKENGSSGVITNYTTKQGLGSDVVLTMLQDAKNNVWFGTQGGGICKLKEGLIKKGESYFDCFSSTNGLPNNVVNSIFESKEGRLLVGTSNGLAQLNFNGNKNEIQFVNYSGVNGLPDNYISNILQMPNGKIALGTNKGIAMFDQNLTTDENHQLKDLELFNNNTGYPIADVNGQGSMIIDSKGILWAGTGDDKIGLVRFDYNAVKRNLSKPKVVIEKIKLNEKDICWYDLLNKDHPKSSVDSSILIQQEINTLGNSLSNEDRKALLDKYKDICFDSITPFYPIPQHLVLPYSQNQITIEFNCIEVSRHNMVNYQYQLEGYDKEWSPVLKKNEATFGNIGEGSYTFKLRAQSPDGVWCEPITYSFNVLAPWYRTWWAYLLYAFTVIGSFVLFFKSRTKALKQRQEDLTLLVRERTAEVVSEKREVEKQKEEAEKQFKRSEELLLNILPSEIAAELKLKGEVSAKQFQGVTVLFTDFVNFTGISQTLSPQALVSEVHYCYTAFDAIMEKNGLEKIKTIGDAYLAVSGMPHTNKDHAVKAIQAAKEIIAFIKQRKAAGGLFDIRIGLNSGPVVAGIVGVKKFAYDIWGDTVNTAARMEQNSEMGKINISGATYELVKEHFNCLYRGRIEAKNKGEIDMYFVE